jgi:hypothetical protein
MAGIMQMVMNNVSPSDVAPEPAPDSIAYLNALSYSGSGTTWTADRGNNATLVNTPTYVAPAPTYFSFSPANLEEATLPALSSLNNWTIEAWFRVTSTLNGQVTAVICDQWNLTNALNFSMGTNNAPTDYRMRIGFFNGAWHNTNGFAPTLNTWYHMVGTYDGTTMKEYINGSLTSSVSNPGTSSSGGVGLRVARRWDETAISTNYFPGDIGLVRIWDTALTATQVTEIYNQNLARFSLTPTVITFTDVGTTAWEVPAGVNYVEYLIVGGGGGGATGYDTGAGGGGGGGMVLSGISDYLFDGNLYDVIVGDGGVGGPATQTNTGGGTGDNSGIGFVATALGGTGGQGSRSFTPSLRYTGGAAQVSDTTAPRGGGGGGSNGGSGGGGGAGGAGGNSGASPTAGGTGGAGVASSITGSSVTYGQGGAGAQGNTAVTGAAGAANRGQGGGGGSFGSGGGRAGGKGGSGIVVVRYGS